MNRAFCNACRNLVPARPVERQGQVFLVKECPTCGPTETLISADAGRYLAKRSLDGGHAYQGCALNCLECVHRVRPTFVFVDITNRCNLNCPICINNTPSMGFLFEPPMEYFERIFKHFSQYDPPPAVQLFGGEPTVRNDLFEIIELARSCGLRSTRVVTNGLRLADPDYCRRLVESRATILIAYDGHNPETYRVLRGNEQALARKQQALENLRAIEGAKVALMTCVAKGFNDREMGELLTFCHERRGLVRGVYFLPLAQTWDTGTFPLEPERMTSEDIELMLAGCFPDDRIDFLPAGILGELPTLMKYLKVKRTPFMGAHPNCESMYLLVSDGTEYVPLARYLKHSVPDLMRAFFQAEERLARKAAAKGRDAATPLPAKPTFRDKRLSIMAMRLVGRTIRRHVRIGRVLRGRRIGKAWHAACMMFGTLFGRKFRGLLERHTNVRDLLQLIVLPFEDNSVLETERLERCPNAFAFWDPRDDCVHSVPTCAWGQHKSAVLRAIADHYAAENAK